MNLSLEHIEQLAPKPSTFKAGNKLSSSAHWQLRAKSERSIWGEIKGSGSKPYHVQIDTVNFASKCSCPSRQFPCKHAIAILLLYAKEADSFQAIEEPKLVSDWLDKRQSRAKKIEQEEKELTEEELQKKQDGKAKRDGARTKFVDSGVEELSLWLKDMIRLGILNLPAKDASFFEQVASRMVDAKAPGLAGWVKGFNKLNYTDASKWQEQALELIAKLYLLLQAYEQSQQLDSATQLTIKSLLGWTFKTKDLASDENTKTQKDHWLVLGSTTEVMDETLTTHRTWLHGLKSNQSAIILAFETKFSEAALLNLVNGSIVEAELAFYPSINPHRAFVKRQKMLHDQMEDTPIFYSNWLAQHDAKLKYLQTNPWSNNRTYLMRNIRFVEYNGNWVICDEDKHYQTISFSFPVDTLLSFLIFSNNKACNLAVVEKIDGFYPLGIFENDQYTCL